MGDETPNDQLQVAYKLKPIVINCPQDEVSSVGSLKDGKVDAAVSFDGQVLALQSDGLLTSGKNIRYEGYGGDDFGCFRNVMECRHVVPRRICG